jgi:RiboL-PSP-HEPN
MNPVFQDFALDLARLKKLLALAESTTGLRAIELRPEAIVEDTLLKAVTEVHTASQNSHAEMPILNGVLLLYLAGRFENYIREIFEDLSDSLAGTASEFVQLPKAMQTNLIKFTAEVIASPRKYGHAENGVAAFTRILADNLNGQPLTGVNSKCLSITSENMWPDTLKEIFARIGVKDVWQKIGQQAQVQQFFQTDNAEKATSDCKSFLTEFMDLRNQIAHPSGALTWPRMDSTVRHIEFCEVIARTLGELCPVWATSLISKTNNN